MCPADTSLKMLKGGPTGGRGQERGEASGRERKEESGGGMVGLMLLPCITFFSVLKFQVGKVYLYLAGNNVANACVITVPGKQGPGCKGQHLSRTLRTDKALLVVTHTSPP